MSHKHVAIIEKVFAHPIATNVDWTKLKHTLEHFGAQISVGNNNRAHIRIYEHELTLGLPHHGHELADKPEITKLRHFLEEVGLTPEKVKAE
ncbi:hypothetical protein [Thiosulfativibrio zosterae]|uniref:Hexulose-6-phosphate isomerase n=1 Tax=Thiosulfativibrio zosterae TaxID=2675053 RepID=A0A6F8PLT2_9GAMM|nr:hypothetical protein [Thiosulfativibrio zosterae]BBP43014.1 hypothetical protein THMIRHAT_07600 [Thiosulfativibrio zosterae]